MARNPDLDFRHETRVCCRKRMRRNKKRVGRNWILLFVKVIATGVGCLLATPQEIPGRNTQIPFADSLLIWMNVLMRKSNFPALPVLIPLKSDNSLNIPYDEQCIHSFLTFASSLNLHWTYNAVILLRGLSQSNLFTIINHSLFSQFIWPWGINGSQIWWLLFSWFECILWCFCWPSINAPLVTWFSCVQIWFHGFPKLLLLWSSHQLMRNILHWLTSQKISCIWNNYWKPLRTTSKPLIL